MSIVKDRTRGGRRTHVADDAGVNANVTSGTSGYVWLPLADANAVATADVLEVAIHWWVVGLRRLGTHLTRPRRKRSVSIDFVKRPDGWTSKVKPAPALFFARANWIELTSTGLETFFSPVCFLPHVKKDTTHIL